MDIKNALVQLSEIASRIKELRDIMGWTVAQMAEKTEVSEEKYAAYESGKKDIPFTFIHKCALLDCLLVSPESKTFLKSLCSLK